MRLPSFFFFSVSSTARLILADVSEGGNEEDGLLAIRIDQPEGICSSLPTLCAPLRHQPRPKSNEEYIRDATTTTTTQYFASYLLWAHS